MSTSFNQLSTISRRIGERFDLVQAGGGNTSIKDNDGNLYVKASGVRLSDIQSEKHFAKLDYNKLTDLYYDTNWSFLSRKDREIQANQIVRECNLTPEIRPSIETLLHAICPGSVIHTHPIVVLQAFSGGENQNNFKDQFAFVPYRTPGIELTVALEKSRKNFLTLNSREPEGIILENHGLVVYAKNPKIAFSKTISIISEIQKKMGWESNDVYNYCNEISTVMEGLTKKPVVTIFAEEKIFLTSSKLNPFFPDGVVFLSGGPIRLANISLRRQIQNYYEYHKIYPKVFIQGNRVYLTGASFSKVREIQEVWDLHLQVIQSQVKLNYLPVEEIHYLSHWEAENFRQNI